MDELTERFFRILTELAVRHCAASEVGGAPGQPGAVSFMATDALARLIVTLVIGAHPGMSLLKHLDQGSRAWVREFKVMVAGPTGQRLSAFMGRTPVVLMSVLVHL